MQMFGKLLSENEQSIENEGSGEDDRRRTYEGPG